MSNRLEVRLLSILMFLDPTATEETVCECDFGRVGRVEFFNEFRLPSPVYNTYIVKKDDTSECNKVWT